MDYLGSVGKSFVHEVVHEPSGHPNAATGADRPPTTMVNSTSPSAPELARLHDVMRCDVMRCDVMSDEMT